MLIIIVGIILLAFLLCKKEKLIEHYRDPLYINRTKYAYDIYPRTNGSLYGFSAAQGIGSWNIFSGYPYYDRAY